MHVYNREVAGAGLREEDGLFEVRAGGLGGGLGSVGAGRGLGGMDGA